MQFSTQGNVACAGALTPRLTTRSLLSTCICIVALTGFSPTNSQGNNIFAAAMSDLSPLWRGARCQGTMDASKCNGRGTCVNCVGRECLVVLFHLQVHR